MPLEINIFPAPIKDAVVNFNLPVETTPEYNVSFTSRLFLNSELSSTIIAVAVKFCIPMSFAVNLFLISTILSKLAFCLTFNVESTVKLLFVFIFPVIKTSPSTLNLLLLFFLASTIPFEPIPTLPLFFVIIISSLVSSKL